MKAAYVTALVVLLLAPAAADHYFIPPGAQHLRAHKRRQYHYPARWTRAQADGAAKLNSAPELSALPSARKVSSAFRKPASNASAFWVGTEEGWLEPEPALGCPDRRSRPEKPGREATRPLGERVLRHRLRFRKSRLDSRRRYRQDPPSRRHERSPPQAHQHQLGRLPQQLHSGPRDRSRTPHPLRARSGE